MTDGVTGPLASPECVAENLDLFRSDDPAYRLFEVDIQPDSYDSRHIPGAINIDWQRELRDTASFDLLSREALEELLGQHGVTRETTIVLYGDFFNWFAAHAYWLLRYYGHENLVLLDGGRKYWMSNDFPTRTARPTFTERTYNARPPEESIRTRRDEVAAAMDEPETCLVDVRAPPEYRGEILAPPGWNEGVQRGGHIPGAINKPCRLTMDSSRRFKSRTELAALFEPIADADRSIIYCRVGERSALVWFVCTQLLGYDGVSYYYGSFVEWGNTVGLPVENPTDAELR